MFGCANGACFAITSSSSNGRSCCEAPNGGGRARVLKQDTRAVSARDERAAARGSTPRAVVSTPPPAVRSGDAAGSRARAFFVLFRAACPLEATSRRTHARALPIAKTQQNRATRKHATRGRRDDNDAVSLRVWGRVTARRTTRPAAAHARAERLPGVCGASGTRQRHDRERATCLRVGVERALGVVGPPLELLLAVRPAERVEAARVLVLGARLARQRGELRAERQQRGALLGDARDAAHREDAEPVVAVPQERERSRRVVCVVCRVRGGRCEPRRVTTSRGAEPVADVRARDRVAQVDARDEIRVPGGRGRQNGVRGCWKT